MNPPDPILDTHELHLIEKLTGEYKKFATPSATSRHLKQFGNKLLAIAPNKLRQIADDAVSLLRSYHIERIVTKWKYRDLLAALAEGAATGAPGLPGVPFNIALSFFLYFRAVQSTALYYGYDVKNDPRELEFASETTLLSLAPNLDAKADALGGLIGKMMLAANLSALSHALQTKTYTEMAKRGGSQLLYVQIRALANRAAEKALRDAGKTGIEAPVFRTLLEQVGRRLPKEAGKKAVPLLGAVIGGLSDTYYMSRVLHGSNLIYHKRFLMEKQYKVTLLSSNSTQGAP